MTATTSPKLIGYRCPQCGSTNCGNDANSVWNPIAQAWVLGNTYDDCWCNDCGELRGLEEYELEGDELQEALQAKASNYDALVAALQIAEGRLQTLENMRHRDIPPNDDVLTIIRNTLAATRKPVA